MRDIDLSWLGSAATVEEIGQQPWVWRKLAAEFEVQFADIRQWVANRQCDEIWFCGAGTSAFIGETLASHLNASQGPVRFRAVATTDLVSSPRNYFRPGVRPLVVSFGRSGDSPESVAVLQLIADLAVGADRLHITCNAKGALARDAARGDDLRIVVLPPESNDSGFAMTSSYSSMLLSALSIFDPAPPRPVSHLLGAVADAAESVLAASAAVLAGQEVPSRAVFLGDGPLLGAARESALKVLELTAGKVTTSWDSSLGFRHGPKAVVDPDTRVFLLLSSNPHTRAYGDDLAREIAAQYGDAAVVRLGRGEADIDVPSVGSDAWNAVLFVLVAQMLAVHWSVRLGLNVDNPFSRGTLTRVVAGVTIHPLGPSSRRMSGGIDLGGTKIESVLFDEDLNVVDRRRNPTRKASYDELVDCVVDEIEWLERAGGSGMPLGVGIPGLVDRLTGEAITANLPATGRTLQADLSARIGRRVVVENDCKCFTLSEANGGAGQGHRTVFGLILGTGIGGGVCVGGKLLKGMNGLPGEVGHFALPATVVAEHGLPLVPCGCGRSGCYETYLAGPGLTRLAVHAAGADLAADEVGRRAAAGDVSMRRALDIWICVLAELLHTVQLTVDPDCVVFGGGLSKIEGLTGLVEREFAARRLPGIRTPRFEIARFGDASGVRGAAMLVR